jgi:hypothetical protein
MHKFCGLGLFKGSRAGKFDGQILKAGSRNVLWPCRLRLVRSGLHSGGDPAECVDSIVTIGPLLIPATQAGLLRRNGNHSSI